ncbi:hypothetical protein GCM10007874_40200 [Labrys miyagiensis]|uniref:Transposase n=1 Tax=Labrys miyagiensis TaxID=346912 RepID=A0ABQ6CKZ2_9HYPH|nr:transposase [Labrys miyagiensis]GLS21003.1 hypothetical protein GCM10007874_40200 [Labrys miyagiensis]
MNKNRTSNSERWHDQYEASKSAAQAIIDKEAEAMRARTNRLREQRKAQPMEASIANGGEPTAQTPIEEVQTSVQSATPEPSTFERRRRWTDVQKLKILAEVAAGGDTMSEVARRHNVSPQLLHLWRKKFTTNLRTPNPFVLPVAESSEIVPEETEADVHIGSHQLDVPAQIGRMSVTCRGGRVLTVDANIATDVLKTLIRLVEEA